MDVGRLIKQINVIGYQDFCEEVVSIFIVLLFIIWMVNLEGKLVYFGGIGNENIYFNVLYKKCLNLGFSL